MPKLDVSYVGQNGEITLKTVETDYAIKVRAKGKNLIMPDGGFITLVDAKEIDLKEISFKSIVKTV